MNRWWFALPVGPDELRVSYANQPCLLQVLGACTSPLTKLALSGSSAAQQLTLPAGSYLSTLETLRLSCSLAHPPPVLAAATRLRSLDLSGNQLPGDRFEISLGDVERVLSPLQHLTELRLSSWVEALDPPATARLFRALPLLKPPSSWERE